MKTHRFPLTLEQRQREKESIEAKKKEALEKSYASVMKEENMRSAEDMPADYEESFM